MVLHPYPGELGHPENPDGLKPDGRTDELNACRGRKEVLYVGRIVLPHQVGDRQRRNDESKDGNPRRSRLGEDPSLKLDPIANRPCHHRQRAFQAPPRSPLNGKRNGEESIGLKWNAIDERLKGSLDILAKPERAR
jgi:hypothetical protein